MKFSKNIGFTIAASLFAISVAATATASEDTFDALDTDQDGVISKMEAQAHSGLSTIFDDVDTDANDVISWAEFSAAGLDK